MHASRYKFPLANINHKPRRNVVAFDALRCWQIVARRRRRWWCGANGTAVRTAERQSSRGAVGLAAQGRFIKHRQRCRTRRERVGFSTAHERAIQHIVALLKRRQNSVDERRLARAWATNKQQVHLLKKKTEKKNRYQNKDVFFVCFVCTKDREATKEIKSTKTDFVLERRPTQRDEVLRIGRQTLASAVDCVRRRAPTPATQTTN